MNFIKIESSAPICLKSTLFCGQVFNFIKTNDEEYTGTLHFFVVAFRQENTDVYYKILATEIDNDFLINCLIIRFFTLSLDYKLILGYNTTGLRLLNNNLLQTIFSFICSSNNNVKRISKMVHFLYSKGKFAIEYKSNTFYFFPELEILSSLETDLKKNGFGYRSKYITSTAKLINKKTEFAILKEHDLNVHSLILNGKSEEICLLQKRQIHKILIKLMGIGPKVRDCISLMGLGLHNIVPIDTHIFKYAKINFNLPICKLTPKIYETIQKLFIEKFGEYSGLHQLFIFYTYLQNIT